MSVPIELIRRHFKYLLDEYSFSIDHEAYSLEVMGNAEVIFKSKDIGVKVVVDRDQVLLNIGKLSWLEKNWFEFTDVVHYFDPEMMEIYVFSKGSLSYQDIIESQVKRLAYILRHKCEIVLNGDFSMQDEIRKIERKRVDEMKEHLEKLSRKYRHSKD